MRRTGYGKSIIPQVCKQQLFVTLSYEVTIESEYVWTRCEFPDVGRQTNVHVQNIPKDETVQRVQITQTKGLSITPDSHLNVLVILCKSLSRRQFFQNLPITHSYLKILKSKQYDVFDFHHSAIVGDNALENQVPLFFGKTLEEFENNQKRMTHKDMPEQGIWTNYRQNGYVTAFAEEACGEEDSIRKLLIQQQPKRDHTWADYFDHTFVDIYCEQELIAANSQKNSGISCVGERQVHRFEIWETKNN
jgi:hypothetical protein